MTEWPETLKLDPGAKKALEKVPEQNPLIATWPEGTKFLTCDQAIAIAKVIIPVFHTHLTNAKIAYLFKQHVGGRGVTLSGKTKLASAQLKFLSDMDFIIELNHSWWTGASLPARVALVDHELSHCGIDDSEKWCAVSHDIEEFNSIVQRWGLWHHGVKQFADVLTQQLDLLQPA